jgi:N-acetylmuramoyl-L-alanine amidase
MALPVRVTLVDPAAPTVVVLEEDTTLTGKARGTVIGAPAPHGTYHWFFLDGTRAAADGRVGDEVRLRLSAESVAWVALADVAALPAGTPAPATRVRLVRLTPRDSSVEARLTLDQRVPFRVDEDARSLTVRLYGAASDLEFVQYGGTDPLVRRVTWAQPAADECTVTFELGAPVFGWRTRWDGTDAVLEIRRPPAIDRARPLSGRTIAVDPGHPPQGATGPTGLREEDANLAVALELRRLLEREGARVVMTRTADTALGLYERTAIAEQANAEILVSIHANALPDGVNPFTNGGTAVYYFHPRAARLAVLTEEALVGELGLRNLGAALGNFALVRTTWMPAILTEGAFLMIPEQENALRTPGFQAAYARGIALGIQAYLRDLAASPP